MEVQKLRAKELRIGNYVIFNTNDKPFPITAAGLLELSQIEGKPNPYFYEPIPLTTEWLRKFGFVFEDIGTNPTEEEKRYRYAEIGFGSKCFGIVFDTEKCTFTLQNVVGELVEYQYVHHLQNVYYWNTFRELVIKDLDPQNVQ